MHVRIGIVAVIAALDVSERNRAAAQRDGCRSVPGAISIAVEVRELSVQARAIAAADFRVGLGRCAAEASPDDHLRTGPDGEVKRARCWYLARR
jgi:hypothetical protein